MARVLKGSHSCFCKYLTRARKNTGSQPSLLESIKARTNEKKLKHKINQLKLKHRLVGPLSTVKDHYTVGIKQLADFSLISGLSCFLQSRMPHIIKTIRC